MHETHQKHELALDSRRACANAGLAMRIFCTASCHATRAPTPERHVGEMVPGTLCASASMVSSTDGSSLVTFVTGIDVPCTSFGARTFVPCSPLVSRIQLAPFRTPKPDCRLLALPRDLWSRSFHAARHHCHPASLQLADWSRQRPRS